MSIHPEQQLQCQNIMCDQKSTSHRRVKGTLIWCDNYVGLQRRPAGIYMFSQSRGHTVPRCHGVSLQTRRAADPSSLQDLLKAGPFHTVKLRIETYMLREVYIVRSGCISHVTLSFVWFLSFSFWSQTHGTAAQSYLTEWNHCRTKLCDWESWTIDKYRQGFSVMDFRVLSGRYSTMSDW